MGVYHYVAASRANQIREIAGQWKDDQQTGPSVRIWTSGERWEGTFVNGRLNGPGAQFDSERNPKTLMGVPQQGIFENDNLKTVLRP
jgi:hypothetical protein